MGHTKRGSILVAADRARLETKVDEHGDVRLYSRSGTLIGLVVIRGEQITYSELVRRGSGRNQMFHTMSKSDDAGLLDAIRALA